MTDLRYKNKSEPAQTGGAVAWRRAVRIFGETPLQSYCGEIDVAMTLDGNIEIWFKKSIKKKLTKGKWHTIQDTLSISAECWEFLKSVAPFVAK